MNNFQKVSMILAVIVVIAMTAIFVLKNKPELKTAILKNSKIANSLLKAKPKHTIAPNEARNFLIDLDMPTRDYEKTGELGPYGKYEARSDYYNLETRDSNRYINNLTYYVGGDAKVVKAVELDLNVNDLSYKSNAIDELIKYSDALMLKATGKNLTPEIKKAMQTQTPDEWMIAGYKIKLKVEKELDEKVIVGLEPTSDHGAFSLIFLIEL